MQRLPGAEPRRAVQRGVSRGAATRPGPLQGPPAPAAPPLPVDDRSDVLHAPRFAASWARWPAVAPAGGTPVAGVPGVLLPVLLPAVPGSSVRSLAERAREDDDVVIRPARPQGGVIRHARPQGGVSGISRPVPAERQSPPGPASTPDLPAAPSAPALQEETSQ
ncbi:hypothetical protein [Arthrobacter sp. TMS1-12-1]